MKSINCVDALRVHGPNSLINKTSVDVDAASQLVNIQINMKSYPSIAQI